MTKDAPPVYPVFVFVRRRDLEAPDRLLAGLLSLNTLGERRLSHRHRVELGKIIDGLAREAREGRLQDIVIGWPSIRPPTNAADVMNDPEMKRWRKRTFTVFVRVDRHGQPTFTRVNRNNSPTFPRIPPIVEHERNVRP